MTDSTPVKYVFSASSARSGSTLMAFLLNAHPHIASIAEMDGIIEEIDPDTFKCSCGELIRECPFWNDVTADMHAQGYPFSYKNFDTIIRLIDNDVLWKVQKGTSGIPAIDTIRNELFTATPGISHRLRHQVERNAALARSILKISGKEYLLDTSKDVSRIHYLNKHEAVDLYVIHLTRDPRGVIASEYRRKPDLDVARVAAQWMKVNQKIVTQSQQVPDGHYIHIRYEDLCTDTLATLKRIAAFLGTQTFETVPEFRAFPHHIIGAMMRLKSSSEIRLDERWKTELTAAQVQSINDVIAPLANQYDYR